MMETSRAFVPDLVNKLENESRLCGRVGLAGVNLFDANNYIATIHQDDDVTPSLVAQLDLFGTRPEWKEFSFCMADYHFYFKTEANFLW
jgi:hypothetical protein